MYRYYGWVDPGPMDSKFLVSGTVNGTASESLSTVSVILKIGGYLLEDFQAFRSYYIKMKTTE